jgi:hypothetical protein
MLKKRNGISVLVLVLVVAVIAFSAAYWSPAIASGGAQTTESDVFWSWGEGPVGTSKLVRNRNGINADISTSGLPAGQAMTAWFIVFNYPEMCSDGECGVDDLGPTPAMGDFLWASGQVINSDGEATFGGHLKVGETKGSGLHEVACPETKDCGIGLIEPEGALVVLAIHSHGPKLKGNELSSQLHSYNGGCERTVGSLPGGFALDATELPVNPGDCSTIQVSPHAPMP